MIDRKELVNKWVETEKNACITGWDFSYIDGKYEEVGQLPWDYKSVVKSYLTDDTELLDIDTGGGEFLLSIGHSYSKTSATEGYIPNVQLCREKLLPLGINFKEGNAKEKLPFEDEKFDVVINRHGSFNAEEVHRVLKKGGVFVTQQVGAENDRELVKMIFKKIPPMPYPKQYLKYVSERFSECGFEVIEGREAFLPIRFFDVSALVWFARIIEWEFPDFTVNENVERLIKIQRIVEEIGYVEGRVHRFFMVARKI